MTGIRMITQLDGRGIEGEIMFLVSWPCIYSERLAKILALYVLK